MLAIVITVSLAIPVFAEESVEPQYGTIKVEYSDARGTIENLEVMVLNGFLYTNVESFSLRLGYCWEQKDDLVSIYTFTDLWVDQAPALALHFRIGTKTVSYNPLCGIEIEYSAPAPCVQNDRGIWVPLSYTLNLLGGSRNVADDVLVIQMPERNVLSIAALIVNNGDYLSFDWVEDFGYSETATDVANGASRVVTLFSGLLEFDGSAWSSFVDWNAFDKKFGRSLAAMLCTYSTDELKESIEEVEVLLDVFDDDGALGSMLRSQQTMINSDVNAWQKICEEKLVQFKAGSGTLPQYNMAYQQYERATKKQDLFSAIGADDAIYIQDNLAEATTALEWAKRIGYGVTYYSEFQQRDNFQATVLKNYFATRRQTDELDKAAAQAIANYASSNALEYTLCKFFEEHALEILVDESGLDALMGVPANLLLLAWDIMSETIPFYRDGLKEVECREISNYAQQVQNDAFENINTLIASLRTDAASISSQDCVQLAEYCYVYLKSCYIARSSALNSLEYVSAETKEILQSRINLEKETNRKIAKYLSILARANSSNSCYILGFLPQNNRELLEMYSDSTLIEMVRPYSEIDANHLVTDAYTDFLIDEDNYEYCFHIPQFNLYGNLAHQVNQRIYDHCYPILEQDVYNCMDEYGYSDLETMLYCWGYQGDLASVVIETNASMWADTQYMVYSISTATGSEVSMDELLAIYSMDREAFYSLVHNRLEQYWDEWQTSTNYPKDSFFDDRVTRTLATENIRKAIPYINPDGGLSFISNIYSLAGGDSYLHLINAEGEIEAVEPKCTQNHNSNNVEPAGNPFLYFIENCDRRYFTEEEIEGFDETMCMYARNAVYAKSGRIFSTEELAKYFKQFSWYTPSIPAEMFTEDMLNSYQIANRDLIVAHENNIGGISAEQAYAIACKYWDYQEGDIAEETGFELYLIEDGTIEKNGIMYYCYRLRWLVDDGEGSGWLSTVDYLYINAKTGECNHTYP